MASNRLPNAMDELLVLAEEMADGLKVHESSVGILHSTESKIRAAVTAARAADSASLAASTTVKACAAAQAEADTEVRAFIGSCKRVLIHYLGSQPSPEWAAIGFPANSIAVPKAVAERQSLVDALRAYLTAHSAYESAPLGVTAKRGAAAFDALRIARAETNAANSSAVQTADAFETAKRELRIRMSGLIFELRHLIGAEDPRWYAFGLRPPAEPHLPAVPENLKLGAGPFGSIHARWSAAPRASRYRVYVKETGDEHFAPRLSSSESSAVVEAIATAGHGGSVWIQVSAANDAGESLPCEPVEIVLPVMGLLAGQAA